MSIETLGIYISTLPFWMEKATYLTFQRGGRQKRAQWVCDPFFWEQSLATAHHSVDHPDHEEIMERQAMYTVSRETLAEQPCPCPFCPKGGDE
jgi:hypothetical protein